MVANTATGCEKNPSGVASVVNGSACRVGDSTIRAEIRTKGLDVRCSV